MPLTTRELHGLVMQRYNEVRVALGDLAAMAYRGVLREPIMTEADLEGKVPVLIADLGFLGYDSLRLKHCSVYLSLTLVLSLIDSTNNKH